MFSLEETVDQIAAHANKDKKEIQRLIDEKEEELSGLVSKEGAAYLVGRELGVNLLKEGKRQLKIKNLVSGLYSVDLTARVVRIFEPREFESKGKKGIVQSIILGDETGTVRLPFWNDEVHLLQKLQLQENDAIKITGAFVPPHRERIELRLGRATIEKVDDDIPFPPAGEQLLAAVERLPVADLRDGSYGEVRAGLIQLFQRNPFYEVCPSCGGRIKEENGISTCTEHGKVSPTYNLVLSGILDDGTGNIRAVFFREQAEALAGKTTRELVDEAKKRNGPQAIYTVLDTVGREFIVRGRVRTNSFTGNTELIASEVAPVDVKKECHLLLKNLKPPAKN